MKRLLSVICILAISVFVSCGTSSSEIIKLKYEPLSEKEERILTLTGDKILLYEINNIPKGKRFEVLISYEIYEKDEKIKEEVITGIGIGGPSEKKEKIDVGVNIQDNKISSNINMGGAISFNSIDIDMNLREMSRGFLNDNKYLKLGDEVYIFHGVKGNGFSPIDLGEKVDEERLKEVLNRHEENFLIKLSIKEITE